MRPAESENVYFCQNANQIMLLIWHGFIFHSYSWHQSSKAKTQ